MLSAGAEAAHPDANIIFGVDFDERLTDALRVIVIATDFETEKERTEAEAKKAEVNKTAEPVKRAEDEDWDVLLKMFDKK